MKGKYGRSDLFDAEDIITANREFYSYIREEADRSYPYHIFGHVAQQTPLVEKNKYGIDTGCVEGNRLTAATVLNHKVLLTSVPVKHDLPKEELYDLFPTEKFNFKLGDLSGREIGRIKWAAEEKVNFISGTMAPSEADVDLMEIEPIHTALQYYKNQGIEEVVLQKKYFSGFRS